MAGKCRRKCVGVGHSLYRWYERKRVKCSVCRRAFDDTGQVYCWCCRNRLSRRTLSRPEKIAHKVERNRARRLASAPPGGYHQGRPPKEKTDGN